MSLCSPSQEVLPPPTDNSPLKHDCFLSGKYFSKLFPKILHLNRCKASRHNPTRLGQLLFSFLSLKAQLHFFQHFLLTADTLQLVLLYLMWLYLQFCFVLCSFLRLCLVSTTLKFLYWTVRQPLYLVMGSQGNLAPICWISFADIVTHHILKYFLNHSHKLKYLYFASVPYDTEQTQSVSQWKYYKHPTPLCYIQAAQETLPVHMDSGAMILHSVLNEALPNW